MQFRVNQGVIYFMTPLGFSWVESNEIPEPSLDLCLPLPERHALEDDLSGPKTSVLGKKIRRAAWLAALLPLMVQTSGDSNRCLDVQKPNVNNGINYQPPSTG